jgi:hypothetical protein
MARDANEVIQTGDIVVWHKAYAVSAALPEDEIDWGDAWAGYTDPGYTDGGIGLNAGAQYNEVRVDQKRDPLWRPFGGRTLEMSFSLAQLSPDNLLAGTGMGSVDTVAPGATARGHESWIAGDDTGTDIRTWGTDILQFNDEAARFLIPKGQAAGNVNPTINRTQKGLIAATITALLDESFVPPRALEYREVLAPTG